MSVPSSLATFFGLLHILPLLCSITYEGRGAWRASNAKAGGNLPASGLWRIIAYAAGKCRHNVRAAV